MSRVDRTDNKLQNLVKPNIQTVSFLEATADDWIVISAGFEDRALETLNRLVCYGSSQFNVLVISYLPHVEENHFGEIEQTCSRHGIKMFHLVYDRPNPFGFSEAFTKLLNQISGRLFLDVSAMSRFLIVQIIVALKNSSRAFNKATVLYAEALYYPPSKEDVNEVLLHKQEYSPYRCMFLSSGVFEVISVPELASVALQGQPIRLICFPSFNTDQLQALRGELQPAYLSVIHGRPPLEENAWRLESIKRLNQTENIMGREDFETSTLDYKETFELLLNIYSSHGAMERLIISPTGSKMQTVAVGLFRAFMDDIQVVYPVPRSFPAPSNYTVGVRQLYSLSLDVFSILQ